MNILYNTLAMASSTKQYFQATGGVEPYVYSVKSGGVMGTINPSTGQYTAPPTNLGNDTIVATDDNGDTAELEIMVASPLGLFCEIIQNQLQLSDGQVVIWDQKWDVPNDEKMYVVVSILSERIFGAGNKFDADGNSVISANCNATLNINIQSRSLQALRRREEIPLALVSNYAESQQEANSFKIGKVPGSFVNLSQVDGPAIPYTFNISVNLQYFVKKTTAVPYFDQFQDPTVLTDN